ncbi:hypothetical protein [Bradyrhizobium sp.]|uniref:hypothetical protein n=1 Tax=Bradyrhizobium sp. TaxID=376 RepID=UPI002394EADC|nr:hypothetical protein [Bradyrhizobium sp.]MDE1937351.1 hypothetical protein [Bradyrhizobium sp.]
MLTEFDQTTIANMTAALEYVCKKIPADRDTHELRKLIGDAMIRSATSGRLSYDEFQNAGLKALESNLRPPKSNWFAQLFATNRG